MIRSSVKELMCEDARLEQLMNIPISEILHYRDLADSVDPEEALRFLADRFIDYDDFQRYRSWQHIKVTSDTPKGLRRLAERWPDEFTEEEIAHFIILNDRLVELQHEVMDQVKVITANLQEQMEKGFHQYDTFCIDGYIIIEPYEEDVENELLATLCQFAQYNVIHANDNTPPERLADEINEERHWYVNWSGIFHQLEKSHGLRLCRAFCNLFEEDKIFTISDIMKIKPEMLLPDVKISI